MTFYRGPGSGSRAYLESDHSHADEYYLENGHAIAQWTALDGTGTVRAEAALDGDAYQAWVDWRDPQTGEERGKPRDEHRIAANGELIPRPASPRFAEMTVNCDKSLSVAAALFPEISAALDDAQADAATAMGAYLARNSVTRTGPRGAQSFVPVERFEQVSVVHRTSRAGDPHRHIHVQWNTRVFADGKWRGLHTAATIKQQGALRGVAEAVINSHEGLRSALAAARLTFDAESGKVIELAQHAEVMSKRALQVQQNVAKLEREWRAANPDALEPPRALQREWDQQAWAAGRPQKVHDAGRAEDRWLAELRDAGLSTDSFAGDTSPPRLALSDVDRDQVTQAAIASLEEAKSAWSIADLEGQIGVILGRTGVVAERDEVAAWVRTSAAAAAERLLRLDISYQGDVPDWVRWITSERVVEVEDYLRRAFVARGLDSVLVTDEPLVGSLTQSQSDAARALASAAPLVVVEGAAGAGKTTMLKSAADLAAESGRRFVVVAPTLRAAQEAGAALGTPASSAHKLAHECGFRRDALGQWSRLREGEIDPTTSTEYRGPSEEFTVTSSTRIIVDEAGMIDQDTAHALVQIAEESGAALALVGDRAQLPAVGRGGVLDMAVAAYPTRLDLSDLHRFTDVEYAELTLQMRSRELPDELFDKLHARGNVAVHATMDDAREAITRDAIARARAGSTVAIATATNEDAATLNALIQQAHADAGHTTAARVDVAGSDLLTIRNGDRIMTRKNVRELGVANRDVWDVERVHPDGSVTVRNRARSVQLPAVYVKEHTHLAYASTEFGVQGATVQTGHGIVTDASHAAAVYVSATRGREANTLHVVAESDMQARALFVNAMTREAGDRGVESKREAAERDLDGTVGSRQDGPTGQQTSRRSGPVDRTLRAERIATEQRVHTARVREWESSRAAWHKRHDGVTEGGYTAAVAAAERASEQATVHRGAVERVAAVAAVEAAEADWRRDHAGVQRAAAALEAAGAFRRRSAQQEYEDVTRAFQERHRAEPAPTAPAHLVDEWSRSAIAVGADIRVDAARAAEAEARSRAAALRADRPVVPPSAPSVGTPAEELAKDAAYRERRAAAPWNDRLHRPMGGVVDLDAHAKALQARADTTATQLTRLRQLVERAERARDGSVDGPERDRRSQQLERAQGQQALLLAQTAGLANELAAVDAEKRLRASHTPEQRAAEERSRGADRRAPVTQSVDVGLDR
ncbi:MobF family relaxase [Microbacterium arborescens]|uniref:MobF family relaxase n=1 Tax=Microbacterium arborescens TaxID=33883 RepID=UPI001428A63B|nr:MobF family relaxase [Microbacterium arborescens]